MLGRAGRAGVKLLDTFYVIQDTGTAVDVKAAIMLTARLGLGAGPQMPYQLAVIPKGGGGAYHGIAASLINRLKALT